MNSQNDNDWQSTKKTVLQRNCHMFNNPLMSDISFTCGESERKCFYAHKYVLATSSTVFYAMFYGDLAEKGTVIPLPDTDEESLEEFLRFLYTDDCTLTADNAIKVMYLADKYIVPSLTEKCVEVIQETLQPDNVLGILEQALKFQSKELEKECWEVVDLQTSMTVTSEAFVDISQGTLTELLKRDTLDIKEVELFQAILKWSDNQCNKEGSEATGDKRREVLGDAVYEIRFCSMSQQEFAQYVSPSGLFTTEDSGFPAHLSSQWKKSRRKRRLQGFTRFDVANLKKPCGTWSYSRGNMDALCFSVNNRAKFHGVYLFGDEKGSKYEVCLKVNGVEVNGAYTSELNEEGVYGFNVMLPKPLSLEKKKVVVMSAKISGPSSYYGIDGRSSVEVDGFTVSFSQASESSNGTFVERGQFYEIILSTARS